MIVHPGPINPCFQYSVRGWPSLHTPSSSFVLVVILWHLPVIEFHATLFWTHSLAMAPTPLETAAASAALGMSSVQRNAHWSKEELFGLLGVICVVLVPCLGFALKCFMVRYWSGRRCERRLPGMIPSSLLVSASC
jgi:hypothetical protein